MAISNDGQYRHFRYLGCPLTVPSKSLGPFAFILITDIPSFLRLTFAFT